ncbi:MAG: RpiB/LacA/LacB family sugar-phosphate isomerase [Patescibacteria group bacterium]
MTIYIGADHRGFALKEYIKQYLAGEGHAVHDCGNTAYDESDDYPDFAKQVAEGVAGELDARGIVLCGSGNGVAIVANKIRGIRAAVALTVEQARRARSDEDANIVALAADYTNEEQAREIIEAFLSTPFLGEERHMRRIGKIE